jgi:DNA-directed RNA polymerase specialized sigma54-like protein
MSEKQVKPRKRISKADSTIICTVFKEKNGKWDSIMADRRIKDMQVNQAFIQQHVNNKKKKVKAAVTAEIQKGRASKMI